MVIVLKNTSTQQQIENLIHWFEEQNVTVHTSNGEYHTILGLVGNTTSIDTDLIEGLEIVESVKRIATLQLGLVDPDSQFFTPSN